MRLGWQQTHWLGVLLRMTKDGVWCRPGADGARVLDSLARRGLVEVITPGGKGAYKITQAGIDVTLGRTRER